MDRKREFEREVGRRIAAARDAAGMTQQELARRAGMHTGSVANYESGFRSPAIKQLRDLAVALGVSTDSLLGIEAKK